MQRERLWVLFGLAAIALCILVYYLFFVAMVSYYIGFLAVFVLALLFYAVSHREDIAKNRKRIVGELGVLFGMCAVYTCIYVSIGVFQAQFDILSGISAVTGLFIGSVVGALVMDAGRSMVYVCIAAVSAIAVAVTLVVSPPLLAGEYAMMNYALLPTIQLIVFPAILTITFSLIGAALGYFIADSMQ